LARLVYRTAALRQLADIVAYIERESQSRDVADRFFDKLNAYCERLSTLPVMIGRPRPEIGRDYRSTTFQSYVIFMRYSDEDGPRSRLNVVHILHGSRDMDALFAQHPDEPD
jgi:plasmid stabilization system protein ParE